VALHASTIVVGGKVWTGAGMTGAPTAVAIRDGRILAVGDDTEISALADRDTRVIEAGGRRIVPGLIDSHIHMVRAGLTWNQNVDWSGVRSLADGLAAIASRRSRDSGRGLGLRRRRLGTRPVQREADADGRGARRDLHGPPRSTCSTCTSRRS
jgi:predicted amidohydrolase YtcJ